MKDAMLGTPDYHGMMQHFAQLNLQNKIGFVPQVMMDADFTLPPVQSPFLERADQIMQALAQDNTITDCNPRSPHLLVAWMLAGRDLPFYLKSSMFRKYQQCAAGLHLQVALGQAVVPSNCRRAASIILDVPTPEGDLQAYLALSAIYSAVAMLGSKISGRAASHAHHLPLATNNSKIKTVVYQHAKRLAYINEAQALAIIQRLTVDTLHLTLEL